MKTLTKINEMTITLGDLVKALAGDMVTNADCLTGKKDCFEVEIQYERQNNSYDFRKN